MHTVWAAALQRGGILCQHRDENPAASSLAAVLRDVRLRRALGMRSHLAAGEGYSRNSLVSSPMPSMATVTVFTFSFITPTPTEVPTAMRSPGNSVISWEILLTSSLALKIMSEIG